MKGSWGFFARENKRHHFTSMKICQANRLHVTRSAVQAWAESLTYAWHTAVLDHRFSPEAENAWNCFEDAMSVDNKRLTRSPNWRHKGSASWRKKTKRHVASRTSLRKRAKRPRRLTRLEHVQEDCMALIGPSCLAGPTKGEEDLQLEEEEGLRPLASRGKDHREGRMNQKGKKNMYIASWKPQTMSKLHKFESAGTQSWWPDWKTKFSKCHEVNVTL